MAKKGLNVCNQVISLTLIDSKLKPGVYVTKESKKAVNSILLEQYKAELRQQLKCDGVMQEVNLYDVS